MKESPIFIKSFETLQWTLEHTRKFPKDQRFVLAKRIEDTFLSFYDAILDASDHKGVAAVRTLHDADRLLERLRHYNRLSVRMKFVSFNQYEHLAGRLEEIGKLLGGWLNGSVTSGRGRPDDERR